MEWIYISGGLIIGLILGMIIGLYIRKKQGQSGREMAQELYLENEALRTANIERALESAKSSFGELSREALARSTEEFLKLAKEKLETERQVNIKELDSKKGLIDQQLGKISEELEKVSNTARELEKDRVEKFGQLSTQLKAAGEQTTALRETTDSLREVLSSSHARGRWGERMAEDILSFAGFIEQINYTKQHTIESGSKPDFTFFLPRNLKLNMDVKFPWDNYKKFVETESEIEKQTYLKAFLKDVRGRMKEVTTRDYINPEQNTVDCVIMFIPNESVFSFIQQQDNSIFDDGIKNKVVACSPLTLFAVLAVIRQAVDNFSLEQTSNEMLTHLGNFKKQWELFISKMDDLGSKLNSAKREFDTLTETRRRQLEKPLDKLDNLRQQRGLPIADEGENRPELL
jgi:DNA recombination protein RmuC